MTGTMSLEERKCVMNRDEGRQVITYMYFIINQYITNNAILE